MDVDEIGCALAGHPHVASLHDLRCWRLVSVSTTRRCRSSTSRTNSSRSAVQVSGVSAAPATATPITDRRRLFGRGRATLGESQAARRAGPLFARAFVARLWPTRTPRCGSLAMPIEWRRVSCRRGPERDRPPEAASAACLRSAAVHVRRGGRDYVRGLRQRASWAGARANVDLVPGCGAAAGRGLGLRIRACNGAFARRWPAGRFPWSRFAGRVAALPLLSRL